MHNSKIIDLVQKCEASNQVLNVYWSSETDCNLSVRYVILTLDQKI
jgi:beta-mannanase